jgi:S-adenosylmethionine hydrolase
MKAVMLDINPDLHLVDISHDVAPHDVMEAAFVLKDALPFFPGGTVHLVVVDPEVGTARAAAAIRVGGHTLVGPDNGLFSLVYDSIEPEAFDEIVRLDVPEFWRIAEPSATFHGRDIFAPVAAHLASGRTLSEVGTPMNTLERLRWALPFADQQGLQGWVVHIDRFGNCVTNITREIYSKYDRGRRPKCYVGSSILEGIKNAYGDASGGEALMLFGSSSLLEVAVSCGNASELLNIRKGDPVNIVFSD